MKNNTSQETGILFILATPIGNLNDFSQRAISTIKQVDYIAAEDTRHSKKFLSLFDSKAKLLSCHKFNEIHQTSKLLNLLEQGKSIALISDAGTPAISDPGFHLVKKAKDKKIQIIPIPGPSSVTTICSISGFDCSQFSFYGFLPKKENEILSMFNQISEQMKHPIVFFESPNRIVKTFISLSQILAPDTEVCVCRELTKKHEQIIHSNMEHIVELIKQTSYNKGEWTCIIKQVTFKEKVTTTNSLHSIEQISDFFSVNRNKAAKILSIISGKSKKEIYQSY